MLVYIAEGSTPFLNITWLLHLLKLTNSKYFLMFAGLLIITFFCFRVVIGPYLVYHMIMFRNNWGENTFLLFYFNFPIIVSFAILNFYWFYKLLLIARGIK
jgi:hypothetical protein